MSAMVTAPVIGFVVDAIRNSESRCTGGPPIDSEPSVSMCTSSPDATSPGTWSRPTCDLATSASRCNPATDNPLMPPFPSHSLYRRAAPARFIAE
jgi:hypothetical protein